MEFRFFYPSCGQKLKAEEEHASLTVDCPHYGVEFCVPEPEPELLSSPAEPPRDRAFANPNLDAALTCPVCWLRFDIGDIMRLAVHDYPLAPEAKTHEQCALISCDNAGEHFQPGGGVRFRARAATCAKLTGNS
jgi:hypothetical protein